LWELRRRFNEEVLATGRLHPYAEHFLRVIREEMRELPTAALGWPAFERLFQRITLRIVFGDHARDNTGLIEAFDTLMFQANRLLLLRPNYLFAMLYQEIRKYLDKPAPHTLAFLCKEVAQSFKDAKGTDIKIDIASQIPHWLFAMKDTLAINTAYCLALLADDPAAGDRARAEIADTPGGAKDVDAAAFLGGCVQEAMRLWPTTPMLERECAIPDILGDDVLLPGTRVIIWNACNHRNPEAYPDCNRFRPERWTEPGAEMWFNHLSSGPQGCAGKELALFIAKAVIAELLRGRRWHNRQPVVDAGGAVAGAINPFQIALNAVVI
jgi:cytochrome P450